MRITRPLALPETAGTSAEDKPSAILPAPRYRPASDERIAAQLPPFVMQGSSGSQARAILAQALLNARRRGFEVIAISRDAGAATREPLHETDARGQILRSLSLAPEAHPNLRVWSARESAQIPAGARVFNSVVAHALLKSVAALPQGTTLFTGQNGVPNALPAEKNFRRQHYISTIASALKDSPPGATVSQGGSLYFDERSPDRDYLEKVLGGGDLFTLKFVPDIRVYQWRKIAANVISNTLCTLFDITFGQLHEHTEKDPRWAALMRGMLAETHAVACARGIALGTLDALQDKVRHVLQSWPAHHSSMHHALVSGETTENAYLAGAIAQESRRLGLAAPLCTRAAQSLERFETARNRAGREQARQFYERNTALVSEEREALLELGLRAADQTRASEVRV